MSQFMKCLLIKEWGDTPEIAEVPVPEPEPDEILIEVAATSVGLTVRNAISGNLGDDPGDLPRIPGHEIVGRVVEVGSPATPFNEGDLVAAYFYLICGRCDACLSGHESLCEQFRGFIGVAADGGFAEYVSLPAESVVQLPDDIDPVAATAVPDAIATPYHVVTERAEVSPGDDVAILGAGGGVGVHLMQVVDHFGGAVTAVDRRDEKLSRCRELGAVHAINTAKRSLSAFAESEGIEFDVVVDFTGSMALVEESLELLASRGRLVNLTGFPGRSFDVSPRELVLAELDVVGSRYCSRYELKRAADLVADGSVEPVISEVVDLADVPDLLEQIADGELVGRGATVP